MHWLTKYSQCIVNVLELNCRSDRSAVIWQSEIYKKMLEEDLFSFDEDSDSDLLYIVEDDSNNVRVTNDGPRRKTRDSLTDQVMQNLFDEISSLDYNKGIIDGNEDNLKKCLSPFNICKMNNEGVSIRVPLLHLPYVVTCTVQQRQIRFCRTTSRMVPAPWTTRGASAAGAAAAAVLVGGRTPSSCRCRSRSHIRRPLSCRPWPRRRRRPRAAALTPPRVAPPHNTPGPSRSNSNRCVR